jgi:DNA-directed RNA polymerase specialized sigma24 family protein
MQPNHTPGDRFERGAESAFEYAWEKRYAEQARHPEGRAFHERMSLEYYADEKKYLALGAFYLWDKGYRADSRRKAEEILDDAIMQISEYRFRNHVEEPKRLFKTILFRQAINAIRKQDMADSFDAAGTDGGLAPADVVGDPESAHGFERVIGAEEEQERFSVVERLLKPEQMITVRTLEAHRGDIKATAKALGTSYGATKQRVYSIREKLREAAPELVEGYSARERKRS